MFKRQPIFAEPNNVQLLRKAVSTMKAEMPFEFTAAVILPDHIHSGEAWPSTLPSPVGVFKLSAVCERGILWNGLGMPV